MTSHGTPYTQRNVLRDFKRVLRLAGLPEHFNLHSLRHTYASLAILNGAKPAWLQQQLGHSSLKLTLDVYAKWLRERDLAAADRQDARSNLVVSNAVATAVSEG